MGLVFALLILAALVAVSLDLRHLSHLAYPLYAGSWYWVIRLCDWAIGLCCILSAGGLAWPAAEKIRFDSRLEGRPWYSHRLVRGPAFLIAVAAGPLLLSLLVRFILTRLGIPHAYSIVFCSCYSVITFMLLIRPGSAADIQQDWPEPERSNLQWLVDAEHWSARRLGGWWLWRLPCAAIVGLTSSHNIFPFPFCWIAIWACRDWIRIPGMPYFRKPT